MKKILFFLAAMTLASCSDFESDYSNLSDKNIRFRVTSGIESRSLAGNGTHSLQQPLIATTSDGSTLYLHPIVQSIERLEQLQREAAASYTNPKGILKESRAALTTENLTAFNVIATRYAAGALGTTAPNFIYVETATKSGAGYWETTVPYLWPANNDKLAFFAYAPGDGAGINLSSASQQGAPTIDFQVQNNPANQIDLITASAIDCTNQAQARNGVPLTFSHMLTSVKFVLASELTGTLKSVTLRGLYTSAKYVYPSAANTGGTWNFSGKSVGSITFDYTGATPAEVSLFLIPQSFGEDASVEAVYNDGTKDITLRASLKNQDWTAGSSVTYKISDSAVNSMKLGNISFPGLDKTGMPKTNYVNGDKAGLYVADAQGNILTNNAMLTYDGTAWSTNAAMPYSADYDYFVYYPYSSAGLANTSNTPSGARQMSRATVFDHASSATTFFAPGIAAWTPAEDQSSAANFTASDLQIAKGILSTTDAAGIDFFMVHAMTLAQITLGTKHPDRQYQLSTDNNYKFYAEDFSNSTTNKAISTFDGRQPYNYTTDKYIAFVKPNTSTQFNSVSGQTHSWAVPLEFNSAGNTRVSLTAYSKYRSGNLATYTLANGDYLYSDGSFAKGSAMPAATKERHPIAVVFSTTTSSTDNAAGYKSGYAVAIASCGGSTTLAKAGSIGNSIQIQSQLMTDINKVLKNLDGRTETVALSDFSKDNYPSAYYATHFGTSEIGLSIPSYTVRKEASGGSVGFAAPYGTSGWFLGSVGQYILMAKNLGGTTYNNVTANTWSQRESSTTPPYPMYQLASNILGGSGETSFAGQNIKQITSYFNAADNQWAPAVNMIWESGVGGSNLVSSSEYSVDRTCVMDWYKAGNFYIGCLYKTNYFTNGFLNTRPVIAF